MKNEKFKSVIRLARRIPGIILRKDFCLKRDIRFTHMRLGTDYGGWNVIPGLLGPESVAYAFGIGEDISFELGIVSRLGASVHSFDPTPQSVRWIRKQNIPAKIIIHEYGLADRDGSVTFYPPKNEEYVSHSILPASKTAQGIPLPVKRLSSIMRELGHKKLDLLKMDIEGSEYAVIDDLIASGLLPGQLLIEFHHRFPAIGIGKTKRAIAALKKQGYRIFHVSESGEEIGFVLSDTISAEKKKKNHV